MYNIHKNCGRWTNKNTFFSYQYVINESNAGTLNIQSYTNNGPTLFCNSKDITAILHEWFCHMLLTYLTSKFANHHNSQRCRSLQIYDVTARFQKFLFRNICCLGLFVDLLYVYAKLVKVRKNKRLV